MEVYATKLEIRKRVQARLGYVTNSAQSPLIQGQIDETIRAAALEIYTRCAWVQTQRETIVAIGIDQRFVDYPDNTTAGNIIAAAIWDDTAKRFCPLRRRPITISQDDEPLVVEGGDASAARRAQPTMYHPKAQIEIWPRPDQAYQLKFDHTVSPDLYDNSTMSVVDAECIILWALADHFEFQQDAQAAKSNREKCELRIRRLRAWAATNKPFKRGALTRAIMNGAQLVDDVVVMPGGGLPNSGSYPSLFPG